jgi:hypothetical protein
MLKRRNFEKIAKLEAGGKKNTAIFIVKHITTKTTYILKEIESKTLDILNEYKEEAVKLLKAKKHPNILQALGYYFYETTLNTYKLGLITEYLDLNQNFEHLYEAELRRDYTGLRKTS